MTTTQHPTDPRDQRVQLARENVKRNTRLRNELANPKKRDYAILKVASVVVRQERRQGMVA